MNRFLTFALALACIVPGLAKADDFPSKPIHLVVPYSPGGTTDAMARVLQGSLQKALGQPVIVDNKSGASGASLRMKSFAPRPTATRCSSSTTATWQSFRLS